MEINAYASAYDARHLTFCIRLKVISSRKGITCCSNLLFPKPYRFYELIITTEREREERPLQGTISFNGRVIMLTFCFNIFFIFPVIYHHLSYRHYATKNSIYIWL